MPPLRIYVLLAQNLRASTHPPQALLCYSKRIDDLTDEKEEPSATITIAHTLPPARCNLVL
jgi:hypothetical protein